MNNLTDKQREFLTKLKDLLKEYNMNIWVDIDGDTHGISECLKIEEDIPHAKAFFKLNGQCDLSHHDIKL